MNAVFDENTFYLDRNLFVEHLEQKKPGRFISINNKVFWPERRIFQNSRMIHLIRHPKDTVISGYHYHMKGPEQWTIEPMFRLQIYQLAFELDRIYSDEEKKLLNPEMTYQNLLKALPFDKGMMTEMVWLKFIETYNPVPFYESPLIETFRFEDIVADPVNRVANICRSWDLSDREVEYYSERAAHYERKPTYEIRDKSPYQFRNCYDKSLDAFFDKHFGSVAARLEYPE
ncbi:MAG: sulfotransferase domain-containing protein [Pseudomonadota bacterium]